MDIGKRLDDAMRAIERSNDELKGVLPKIFGKADFSPQMLGGLIDHFTNLIDKARTLFDAAFPAAKLPATWSHGNRTFTIQDYLGFMLLVCWFRNSYAKSTRILFQIQGARRE